MTTSLRSARLLRRRRRVSARLVIEPLERRQVRSGSTLPYSIALEPSDTVDLSLDLGRLADSGGAGVVGVIGDGPAGASDVDWYGFTLDRPARVVITAGGRSQRPPFRAVVGLYNNDPFAQDPYNPSGHRLLGQDIGGRSDDPAQVERILAPGTYHVAVSGAGNRDFYPLLAGSGLDGEVGDYGLRIATDAVEGDGLVVLTAEPASGAVLGGSPFAVRLTLSGPIDPGTILPDETVRLIYNAEGTFGDEGDRLVPLGVVNFSIAAGELQLFPLAPLGPGHYRIELAGEAAEWRPVLTGPDATPFGATPDSPKGRDYSSTFRIDGAEGGMAADDTAVTANDLGDITNGGLIRIEGAIGDDPYYDPSGVDDQDFPLNAANDVDMHRFRIRGQGQFAFVAEVFAGRIGSPLDPGISLFRVDPTDGSLHLVAGNNNSQNPTRATDGPAVLLTDSVLYAALTEGDYVLVVSSSFNTPSPLEDQPVGGEGLFDPLRSHSGRNGSSTGPYVLGLRVLATPTPPKLVGSNPIEGETFDAPPTHLSVRFSEPVNVALLAFKAYRETSQSVVTAVYIEAADGTRYFPRFESYDAATNTATFLMLDGLPAGSYTLHLSGREGLAGFGGLPLEGDGRGGDAVVHFQVDGAERVLEREASGGYVVTRRPGSEEVLDLGVLFARELEAGIAVVRETSETADGAGDWTEAYRFQVLQRADYNFTLSGDDLPDGLRMTLVDDRGEPVPSGTSDAGGGLVATLSPGTYRLRIEGRGADGAAGLAYRVDFGLLAIAANAPPLASGPAPSLQLRLTPLPGSTPTGPTTGPDFTPPTSQPGGEGPSGGTTPGQGSGVQSPTTATPDFTPPTSQPGREGPSGGTTPGGGSGVQSPTTPTSDFSPSTSQPGGEGPFGGITPGPGSSPADIESAPSTPTPSSPGGLIALSVSPIGNLHGNAEPFAPGSTQVAFHLPSEAPSIPSLGQALAQLVIATQGPGGHDPAPDDPDVEVSGPALIFVEGLRPVFVTAQVPSGLDGTVTDLGPSPAGLPASRGAEGGASEEIASSEEDSPGEEGEEADEAGGETQLATLASGAWLASVVAALFVLFKRFRSARSGDLGLAKPKGGRDRRSLLSRIGPWGRPTLEEQGLSS